MRLFSIFLLLLANLSFADTIDNYMKIANNIPIMEMKADLQAQAWARSARHVLTITCESIAETLHETNERARRHGQAFFCLKNGAQLNSVLLNNIIQQTYKDLSSKSSDKNKMTVSQIALLGVSKHYPCQKNQGIALIKSISNNPKFSN